MSTAQKAPHFAKSSDFSFVEELLSYGESHPPQPGDLIEFEPDDIELKSGDPLPSDSALVVKSDGETLTLKDPDSDQQIEVATDGYFRIVKSPLIQNIWESHLRKPCEDGVSFGDDLVEPGLLSRLRAEVKRLIDEEPVDYHPGSGTKVRDLVHPSLYPYIEGRSVAKGSVPKQKDPEYDRFGRPFESSRFQWLPTPFAIAKDGSVQIASYINNLDRQKHPSLYDALAELFATALPLIESVVGYVDGTKFWQEECEDIEHEGELPESSGARAKTVKPTKLRERELQVIPKIVEYRLGAGETHEGVWHVEGMSHEHIVATCVYILDRDDSLSGGTLRFKRAYTVEEAGRLFWNIDQCRPRPIEQLVNEGTIPLGSLETPQGRLLVFPNSHIHKLSELSLAAGASEGRRRVIVFWIVDPNVQLVSTREVAPQQGVIPQADALAIRLELMEERKRHKQSLNVRAVSLCEH